MEGMLDGLRHRLERSLHRMEEQHALLREIADQLDGAVAKGVQEEVETWLSRFVDALRAHFDLEERVVFPALHGMMDSAWEDLSRLEEEHGIFLEGLGELLGSGGAAGATLIDALGTIRESLRDHERLEEALISRALSLN